MFYQDRIVHLLQESFRCIRTNSLREAYRAILNERPSIVILELNQPDGDGLDLIAHLRTDPTLKGILIACVTQRSNTWDKVFAWRAGADDYIVKPLTRTFHGQMLLLKRAGLMARV
jgi:DNA-binding response OmpR family regulator